MSESKRLDAWERLTDWPLLILAVLFLGAYAWEVIGNLQGRAATSAEITELKQQISELTLLVESKR